MRVRSTPVRSIPVPPARPVAHAGSGLRAHPVLPFPGARNLPELPTSVGFRAPNPAELGDSPAGDPELPTSAACRIPMIADSGNSCARPVGMTASVDAGRGSSLDRMRPWR
ncbi:hypothetical protein GCM10027515_02480 [Schumannella luteola]